MGGVGHRPRIPPLELAAEEASEGFDPSRLGGVSLAAEKVRRGERGAPGIPEIGRFEIQHWGLHRSC